MFTLQFSLKMRWKHFETRHDAITNMIHMSVAKNTTQKIQVKWNMKFFVSFHLYFLILYKMVIGLNKRLICISPLWPFYAIRIKNTGRKRIVGTGLSIFSNKLKELEVESVLLHVKRIIYSYYLTLVKTIFNTRWFL